MSFPLEKFALHHVHFIDGKGLKIRSWSDCIVMILSYENSSLIQALLGERYTGGQTHGHTDTINQCFLN
jgi:hypothetical protein